jgi:hypothetical protein
MLSMNSKKVIITQSNYIPWKGYFDAIHTADEFIIYDDMQYTKRDWRNRNQIKTPQGLLWLSIPVQVKGKFFQKINETEISDAHWAKDHWKIMVANYKKAPHFQEFEPIFSKLYLENNKLLLTEINHLFIVAICEILGISTKIRFSSEFVLAEEKTERLVSICKEIGATDYYSGPAAKAYMNETLFEQANIKVHYFDYSGYPAYHQLYGDFAHSVSILDLIFNEGKNATQYMKSFKS